MNRTPGRRARAPATGTLHQGHHSRATPAANIRNVDNQVPLFGPPIVQRAAPSAEQIALKRQRLTTTYEPLNPPEDDATTAEGVRMGVVTDQDGRHWRQQTMRLGRWVTHWKDTYPFPAQPVDVEDLTKAEKYWLDIKFRRRIPKRKMPIKQAPGRGCTGGYWALRRGNRGVLSGRVGKAPGNPSSRTGAGKNNDPVSPGDRQGDLSERSPSSPHKPTSYKGHNGSGVALEFLKGLLLDEVLAHYGIESLESVTLRSKLLGLLPDELFSKGNSYPKLEDVPTQKLTEISDILRSSGLPLIDSSEEDDTESPGDRQYVLSPGQEQQRFVIDVLKDAGIDHQHDLPSKVPSSFMSHLYKNVQALQDSGQGFSAEFRAQMAADAAKAAAAFAASGGVGNSGNTGSETGAGAGLGIDFGTGHGTDQQHKPAQSGWSGRRDPVFISAAQAAADQNRYWAVSESGESMIPRSTNDPGHRRCSEDQLKRILVRDGDDLSLGHTWVEMQQLDDTALVYVRDDRTAWYIPLDRALTDTPRVVNLRLSNGTELAVEEAQVATAPEHSGAVILSCDPIVNDFEWGSKRLVPVQHAGVVQNVPDNKLGAYLGGVVNPPDALKKKVPIAPGRTIDLRQSDGVMLTIPVSEVDNFQHGGATIVGDSHPPANVGEQTSDRMVWIDLGPAAGSQTVEVPDNQLGLFKGSTLSQPRPINQYRIVRLKQISRTANSVSASELSNWGHQGRIIVDTVPPYDSLETPSSRLVHVSTRPDMVDVSVPDNQLGRYPGAVIRAPPESDGNTQKPNVPEQAPTNRNQLVVLKLPGGGPEVRIPVSSASSAQYLGAKIVRTIPDDDRDAPPSKTTVHVSDDGAHFDVPDNGLGRYHGWVISTPPNLTGKTPEKRQTGIQQGDFTLDREGQAKGTTQTTSSFGSMSSQGKDSSPSKTSSMASASMKGQAFGGGKTSTQDKAATQIRSLTQDKASTHDSDPAVGKATPQSQNVVQPATPSTQGKATAQSKVATQDRAAPQVKATTQPTPPSTQASAAPADPSGWETNAYYPISINAPEFISPTKKDFPSGRPNKDGNLPQPRPPRVSRGAPHELERLRQIRDRLNSSSRKNALHQHLMTAGLQSETKITTSGSGASTRAADLGSVVGAVTVRAGSSAPAPSTGPQRPTIQGTSRANVTPGTVPAPAAKSPVAGERPTTTTRTTTTTKTTIAAKKSARVEKKSGKGVRMGRNVRFGPLPTEADTGGERRKGLRTRSGALYGKQRKSGKGVGK